MAKFPSVSKKYAPHAGALGALVVVFAACFAALLSHVAIDIAGDFLLAHDTYDGLDHRSRSDVFAFGLTIGIGALLRIVWGAIREAHTGRCRARPSFDDVYGSGPWRFVLLVVALTVPALAAMEAFDLVCSGSSINAAADLFGGSFRLGFAITIPVAVAAAFAVRFLSRLITASQHSLAVVFERLIALLARTTRPPQRRSQRRGAGAVRRNRSILARRSGKRGPPAFVS